MAISTGLLLLILGVLAACGSGPTRVPQPSAEPRMAAPLSPTHPRSRWVPVAWSELLGWEQDQLSELWPALMLSCTRPSARWIVFCTHATEHTATDDGARRDWLQERLQPYRVESAGGSAEGLLTGYYEPLFEASRQPQGAFQTPLYAPPPELDKRKPYWTREQMQTRPDAQAELRGHEIAYLADPIDALILQVQGSGRLRLRDSNGSSQLVRAAFAGHNAHPYKSVARWLIEQGELKPGQGSWSHIKAWARANPHGVNALSWSNPRVVFFREEALPNPDFGPRGAQSVALTPGRSIAVDPLSVPFGVPVWLDTIEPGSDAPLRRLVMAQDTGAAITGAVRADFFWGWGETAKRQANRTKQALRMWVLWPRTEPQNQPAAKND